MKNVRCATIAVVAVLAAFAVAPVWSQNLVSNGDFETPDAGSHVTTYYAGETFGDWTVDFGNVDHVGGLWEAASGRQSVDLTGYTAGAIYQDLSTIPGQQYRLRFAMSGNPENPPPVSEMEVWWGSYLVDTLSFDSTGHWLHDMGWGYHERMVVATGGVTRLKFVSLTTLWHGGPALDDVSVVLIPEPATILPLLCGLGGLVCRK